jgi:tRNA-dihydrouridine synthase 3
MALIRSHPAERCFGVQLAGRAAETLGEAAKLAEARGAHFIDLNCGCPIHAIAGKGLGAALLLKPARLARLVEALVAAVSVPVTVKLRTGWKETKQNVREVARLCEEAGASAIAIHGRSREQRYSRAADWSLIGEVAAERNVPVIGNGDILTHFEASARRSASGVKAVMLGRGALIKPWLFWELREERSWLPTAAERLGVLWRFVELLRDHFGDDEKGRTRSHRFLVWHLDFFCRYRPLPEQEYAALAREHPLIQRRHPFGEGLDPLEALLRDSRTSTHESLADVLLSAEERGQAEQRALSLALGLPRDDHPARVDVSAADVAG